jgi:3-phosphoshikimate 1-carboxyvinyltransferase
VGTVRVPGDKSITHRAILLAGVASADSVIRDPLDSDDCRASAACVTLLGSRAEFDSGVIRVTPGRWSSPVEPLDCGNSGTTIRLLSGLIASHGVEATLIGDESLSRRPMRRIAEPLRLMGAEVLGDRPPITIRGTENLKGISYATPVASAQIKSCVLLAALRASGTTRVTEPSPSRDHTERMLRALGVDLQTEGTTCSLEGGQSIPGFEICIPGDISSAAFFMVAALIGPGSRVKFEKVGVNPTRTGLFDVLEMCGANVEIEPLGEELGEPRANVVAESSSGLRPFEISGALVPRLIDEIPVLAVLASQIEGTSVIRDARELRVKESDRIRLVAEGLRSMGAHVEEFDDGLAVTGPARLAGARIDAAHDHRIAMAFAIAGLIASEETEIHGEEAIATSYPTFLSDLDRLTSGEKASSQL